MSDKIVTCGRCGENKIEKEFGLDATRPSGRGPYCKECKAKYIKDWRKRNAARIRVKTREDHLKNKYGITTQEFTEILSSQNGRCAICLNLLIVERNICVDHDHVTGAVRGILCRTCNTGIGQFEDRCDLLERAIGYLKVMP